MEQKAPAGRAWEDLDPQAQTDLRIAFGQYLDTLPPTCSLETKIQRFQSWLLARGIVWSGVP
ncbi:hypothetical protein [Thiorhodococcus minor]|uniref:Uncharacterized protein n=1 Tax=Thiorhodococcus minor TaxID=57489 RepID=A0A6M0K584_9GAMM|nr:hypothetical protein [Thiorhodococcus minor]NEV64083.1 hypothetical protein [Thiorhodococcus minor]